jgi:3-methylcrotonyl-CoA carboxylase alpha subunit
MAAVRLLCESPLAQDQLQMHAIEARIWCREPDNQFLPATGIAVHQTPDHTAFERGAVRIDDGVREGDMICRLRLH